MTAEAGRTGTPQLLTIGDATGGIAVRLPAGTIAPARGTVILVSGPLAAPYGQLEIRPAAGGIATDGVGSLPDPVEVNVTGLGEATDGRLMVVTGRPRDATQQGGDRRPQSPPGTIGHGLGPSPVGRLQRHHGRRIPGRRDVSNRRHRRAAGHPCGRLRRLSPLGPRRGRHRSDDRPRPGQSGSTSSSTPKPSASRSPSPTPTATIPTMTIAQARRLTDRKVAIAGIVTAPATLLDGSRLIVVQDLSGAIEVRLPDTSAPPAGLASGRRRRQGRARVTVRRGSRPTT